MESELAQMKGALLDLDDNLERLRAQLRELELQAEAQMHTRRSWRSRAAASSTRWSSTATPASRS
jgi:hypothetical protein